MHNHSLQAVIPSRWHGVRLDKVLAHLFPHYSRTYLSYQIQQGNLFVNAQLITKVSAPALADQLIELRLLRETQPIVWKSNAAVPFSLIYEDEALLILNKPAGLVTHPAVGHPDNTLANALLNYLPKLAELPRAGIVHRLDKDTSGLLVIPKTLIAHTYLIRAMQARKIERVYQAVVNGRFTKGDTIHLPIGRHPKLRQKQAVIPQGKPAITHYRIKEHFKHHTLLTIQLETGRTHQIRVHMAHLHHPIVGDTVYGKHRRDQGIAFKRQALHAYKLRFIHPLTQRYLHCEAPIPEDMATLIEILRLESSQHTSY